MPKCAMKLGARFGAIFFVLHLALAYVTVQAYAVLSRCVQLKVTSTYSFLLWSVAGCEMVYTGACGLCMFG